MIVVATSDLHGMLPEIPPCDLLLIAGDICPAYNHKLYFQRHWLDTRFRPWLEAAPARRKVGVWGNHDIIGERAPHLVPDLPWDLLTDSATEFDGLRIYGLPWQLRFFDWAFNLDEPELSEKYARIPDCDIIVSHGPPLNNFDLTPDGSRVGSPAFLAKLQEIQPRLAVWGHIHHSHGWTKHDGQFRANVAYVGEDYVPRNPPMTFTI